MQRKTPQQVNSWLEEAQEEGVADSPSALIIYCLYIIAGSAFNSQVGLLVRNKNEFLWIKTFGWVESNLFL